METNHPDAIWEESTPASLSTTSRRSKEQKEYECVVVGGGITGMTAALLLVEGGRKVAVLGLSDVGSGTSGGTTAHLTADYDQDYSDLEKMYDTSVTQQVSAALMNAIDFIEKTVKRLHIDCEFLRVPAYYYTERDDRVHVIEENFGAVTRAGLTASLREHAPLPFPVKKAYRRESQAQFNPMQYLAGLKKEIERKGGTILTKMRVEDFADGDPSVLTVNHEKIFCRSCDLCDTHAARYLVVACVGGCDIKTAHGSEADSFRELESYCRFSVDGMTFGTFAGKMLVRQIIGEETAYDELFDPSRHNFRGLTNFFKENYDVANQFIGDWIKREPELDLAHLRCGEGCIAQSGQKKLAAYREDSGRLQLFSAVCPHMKCIVRWNTVEKTFDCPCHGSRFTTKGELIEGPSLANLERV